ncbi:MAG TPA: streptomycin biosynthesis protein StrF [Firmicutes bacterium]|jgi:hypothetical protein|nr:streptomycin biosynthesis protein StrF [Bacillota bacterium]
MVDSRKICFIYCVNNDHLLFKSFRSIDTLHIPGGYTVENRIIKNARSITKAYNDAMKSSNAKYKVYLHQDMVIINPNFLKEMVMIFLRHPQLGLMGVAGAKQLPPDAYWPHASACYGKFMWGEPENASPFVWNEVVGDYETVQAIDGVAMISQYDVFWREDIFSGWHFYDISQSLEFINAGYQVGVARQTAPWFLHQAHDVSMVGYEDTRQQFLFHYGRFIVH